VAQAVHGTTLGSNVVIERKARGIGLLTTRGFRDVLIIGREKRYQVYDLQIEKPRALIPRRLIGEVSERILADGTANAARRGRRAPGDPGAGPGRDHPSRCACSTPI
jgi:N-methylhydantoinase A/oxoprolinase/acetone carboxylase beta subunit